MKFHLLLILALAGLSCNPSQTPSSSCELIDLGRIGMVADSLREAGEHARTAHLYFSAGTHNQSSELFVYAAWQFGEAGLTDSALIALKQAIHFGMNNPYILDKVGIAHTDPNSPLRQEVDQLLAEIAQRNSSIDNFEIVRSPINRFWHYFDQARQDTAQAKALLAQFICEGSPAIKDYYHIRYEKVENMHRTMLVNNPEYYVYLQKHLTSDRLDKVARESRQMMERFAELYPKAIFPKTYLVPDLINGTGTLTELGLFIGLDMFAKSDSMPLQNLNDWQISTISEFDNMKFHLVHELMHFQQSYGDEKNRYRLLGKLVEEGVCDFLVSLLTPDHQISADVQRNLDYVAHPDNYAFVLSELKRDVYSTDLSLWMHNGGGIQDRPSNLGYTMGFLICQSYYENSEDKQQAIFELLNTDDFSRIIEESDFKAIL